MEAIHFRYIFRFPDERQENFDLYLDAQLLDLLNNSPEELPSWTNLDFHQCPNCQLTIQTHSNCPVAVHLVKLIVTCKNVLSSDVLHVDIITPERVVSRDTTAQKGISYLMGLIMATSGCPHTLLQTHGSFSSALGKRRRDHIPGHFYVFVGTVFPAQTGGKQIWN